MTPEYGKIFVALSGFKILRRWLKVAEEEDCIEELRTIVAVCSLLPFDSQAVKDAEIGKAIKKLLKLRGNSSDASQLHEDVKSLMKLWTDQVTAMAKVAPTSDDEKSNSSAANDQSATSSTVLNSIVRTVSDQLKSDRVGQQFSEMSKSSRADSNIKQPAAAGIASEVSSIANLKQKIMAINPDASSVVDVRRPIIREGTQSISNPMSTSSGIISEAGPAIVQGAATISVLKALSINREKRADMAQEAKKQLALQQQKQLATLNMTAFANSTSDDPMEKNSLKGDSCSSDALSIINQKVKLYDKNTV